MGEMTSEGANLGAGIDLSQFYQVFFEEAGENLDRMEQQLLEIDIDRGRRRGTELDLPLRPLRQGRCGDLRLLRRRRTDPPDGDAARQAAPPRTRADRGHGRRAARLRRCAARAARAPPGRWRATRSTPASCWSTSARWSPARRRWRPFAVAARPVERAAGAPRRQLPRPSRLAMRASSNCASARCARPVRRRQPRRPVQGNHRPRHDRADRRRSWRATACVASRC